MESEKFYRGVFYAGSAWNFVASVPTFFLVGVLPDMIEIDAPRYPIFIYFNLMTMFLFGCIQYTVGRNLGSARPFIKILVWSKFLTVLIFLGGLVLLSMPLNLINFFVPGIFLDLIFGLLFWRYLSFASSVKTAVVPAS